jgi:hypothetical protein
MLPSAPPCIAGSPRSYDVDISTISRLDVAPVERVQRRGNRQLVFYLDAVVKDGARWKATESRLIARA